MHPRRRTRTIATLITAVALVCAGQLGAVAAQAAPLPRPASMAAIGDSISQATSSCGYRNCPQYSWSTGTSYVSSHAQRIKASGMPGLVSYNNAVAGANSAGLLAQAQAAVTQQAQYVTVQIGANDACTSSVATMTPTATFATNVSAALAALAASPAQPQVFVTSIPNLQRLWETQRTKSTARLVWALGKICPSMLANASSTKPADVARRAAVQLRVDEYNAALAAACTPALKCTWDGGTVANYAFTSSQVSILDYFHPSISGQATLAAITWPVSPFGKP